MLFALAICHTSKKADEEAAEIMRREQDELIERSLNYEEEN